MNRRRFIMQSALVSVGSILSMQARSTYIAQKYKMGLQLFTVRTPLANDLRGTIKKISAIGYEDCETYGYDPTGRKFYGMPAADFKKLLEDHGMITTSGHYDFSKLFDKPEEEMMRYVDQCIEGARALNQRYITWPWLDPAFRTIAHFEKLTGKLNVIGEQVKKAGLKFAYHHHDFEFTDHNGQNGYNIILKETDPALVKLQMDLYWVAHSSKISAVELINKHPGRFVMWHIKDMDKRTRDYSELGSGSIDFTVILPSAAKAGLEYYYIEQGGNFAQDPIQSITDSAAYFKSHLEKYLT